MEYALITAFLILVIVLSVLAYVGHKFIKNDIRVQTLQAKIATLTRDNTELRMTIAQLEKSRQTPTLQQALQQTSFGMSTSVPIRYAATAPYFIGTQYEEQ